MSVGAFAAYALQHPAPLVRTVVSDAVNIAGNTGVAMVYGRYLGLFDLGETVKADMYKWRDVRDRERTLALLAYMARTAHVALAFQLGFTDGFNFSKVFKKASGG